MSIEATAVFSRAAPGFAPAIRELDGQVPGPLLCVDTTGHVHAAALPASAPVSGSELEGGRLQDLASGGARRARTALDQLRKRGHARLMIDLAPGERVEGFLMLVEQGAPGSVPTPRFELLPGIVDAAPFPLLALDGQRVIMTLNASCRELLGPDSGALVGRPLAALFGFAEQAASFEADLAAGVFSPRRCRVGAGANEREVVLAPRPVLTARGRPRGFVVWLQPAAEEPRSTSQSLEESIQSMAHDLRSPLCSVRGFASLLERDFAPLLGETGCGYLDRLRSSVDRMQGLLEELLELSRVRQALGPRVWLAPRDLFASLAAELKPQLEERAIELALSGDPPLVYADPTRFYQVVLNLVTNAIQHMGSHSDPRIEIAVECRESSRVLVVRDNGCGIDPDDQQRIFELFTRGKGSGGRSTGLGLALVKRIMAAHGGRIAVVSTPGSGATFEASFPDSD
jgi:signal transduction histidine kinase